ncbi:hypothetical protein LCGC14_1716910, partial [marine sediment metagenome]
MVQTAPTPGLGPGQDPCGEAHEG